jgi:hypothetical protein
MNTHTRYPTAGLSPREQRQYVRIRDYHTGETIYCADALHDGWEREVQIYLGYFADIEQVETDDGFTLITADDKSVGYIGDHPDLPINSQQAAE